MLPVPSEAEVSVSLASPPPMGSTIQYQPDCGWKKRRSPSCGVPESRVSSSVETELMTL